MCFQITDFKLLEYIFTILNTEYYTTKNWPKNSWGLCFFSDTVSHNKARVKTSSLSPSPPTKISRVFSFNPSIIPPTTTTSPTKPNSFFVDKIWSHHWPRPSTERSVLRSEIAVRQQQLLSEYLIYIYKVVMVGV